MRGGAQSQLMLGADRNLWVVKFQNNPQHLRVLANELLASRLAEAVGLTVPVTDVVDVSAWLIDHTASMHIELAHGLSQPCCPGLQFGSRFIGGLMPGQVVDYLPEPQLDDLRNLREFAGMLALDKWTGNANGRQAVFDRRPRERRYRATFIDQGFCFNAGDWTFPDTPLRGVYARNRVYARITGWPSFEPWLTRIEELDPDTLFNVADLIPPEWYAHDMPAVESLLAQLVRRRQRVRSLIAAFRDSNREPFPLWDKKITVAVPPQFEEGASGKFIM
jgi:hypothetical protein